MEVLVMNYYWISTNNDKVSTVAYAPKGTPVSHYLIEEMRNRDDVPFSLELRDVFVTSKLIVGEVSDVFYDYQPNSLAWPVMSEKMKSIIASHLTGSEYIELKSITINGKDISQKYYIPMFTRKLDILNVSESVYVPVSGIVLKPCFDKEKIKNLSVIHSPNGFWQITTQIYVNEEIKRDLIDSGIEELCFSRVKVK